MSRKKYTFDLNFAIIVPRLLKAMRFSRYNQLAEILDISPQALSNFKKKGVFPASLLMRFATEHKFSIDEILGLEFDYSEHRQDACEILYAEYGRLDMQDEIQKVILQIKKSWIKASFGAIPNNFLAWQMNSDNMSPFINRNDFLLFDTRVNKIDGSGIYAFLQNEKIIIRRILERLDGKISVINENPSFRDFNGILKAVELESENIKVLGRVVFVGKIL